MDSVLKARGLGSAAARRQRLQERQLQKQLAYEEFMARKRQIMSDVRSLDCSEDGSEDETGSNQGVHSVVVTPSESNVRTPDNSSSPDPFITLSPTVYSPGTQISTTRMETQQQVTSMTQKETRPKMQATLTTIADWNYDRFSIFIEHADGEELAKQIRQAELGVGEEEEVMEEEEESDESSSSDDDLEECSPIEVATPVSYTLLKMKPSVVSIINTQNLTRTPPLNNVGQNKSITRRHVSEQLVLDETREPFRAGEPRLFQTSNSSRETLGSSYASSQASRSISLASQTDSSIARSFSQTSQSDQSRRSPKRKSSMPLLFGTNKNGHSRMSSLKKFIRTSTLGPPAPSQPYYGALQRAPSSATLETHYESRNNSLDILRDRVVEQLKRPMTARAPSPLMSITDDSPVLPPAMPTQAPPPPPISAPRSTPDRLPAESTPRPPTSETMPAQQVPIKPVSRFRQRSGSIGQALKSMGSVARRTEASAPPVPALFIPPPSEPVDVPSLPTPPPITPRHPRRGLANSNPFPTSDKQTPSVPVGLGLRY